MPDTAGTAQDPRAPVPATAAEENAVPVRASSRELATEPGGTVACSPKEPRILAGDMDILPLSLRFRCQTTESLYVYMFYIIHGFLDCPSLQLFVLS